MGYRGVLKEASWSGMELGKRLAGWRKLYVQRPCGGGSVCCYRETMGKPVSLEHRELGGLG